MHVHCRNTWPLLNRRSCIATSRSLPPAVETNLLLDALPDAALEPLIEKLHLVSLPVGMEVGSAGMSEPCTWFPTSCVVSLSRATGRGNTSQIAMVANEGLVGVSAFMGGNSSSGAVVISAGMAFRMERSALQQAFDALLPLRSLLLRYTQALLAQVSQSAVCNRHHQTDQQLCSLLLLCRDRFGSDDFVLTHEQLADMLGVRREGVTHAAFQLQTAGLIRYARGHIHILDHAGLEMRACECYAVVQAEYARLLLHRAVPNRR